MVVHIGNPDYHCERDTCQVIGDNRPKIKALALQAKQFTVQRLREGKKNALVDMMRDKYFRICTGGMVDGQDIGSELIKAGLAKTYGCGKTTN